jgi:hypothetical protein
MFSNINNSKPSSKQLLENKELSNLIKYLDNDNKMSQSSFVDFLKFSNTHEVKRIETETNESLIRGNYVKK